MTHAPDPFVHHPELRDLIDDPLTSPLRNLSTDWVRENIRAHGFDPEAIMVTDDERISSHRRFLETLAPGDLWVFAYGSLMWNPAFVFAEVRRAHTPDYARDMLIKDTLGGRGTPEAPGMIAALDRGAGCTGLAFRILQEHVEEETVRIWNRERLIPAYHTRMIPLQTDAGPISAMTFVADHSAELIDDTLSRDDVAHYVATGSGFLGSSLDYVENLCTHLEALRIDDARLFELRDAARALAR